MASRCIGVPNAGSLGRRALGLAPFSGVIAAIVWLLGTPLFAFSGILGPNDYQEGLLGLLTAGLGLTLLPLMASLGRAPLRHRRQLQLSGIGITVAMTIFGASLVAAAAWGLHALEWISAVDFVLVLALFAWMLPASWAARGPSTRQRWLFWVGLLTAGPFLLQMAAWTLVYFVNRNFVVTNGPAAVGAFLDLILWILFPAWLIGLAVEVGGSRRPSS